MKADYEIIGYTIHHYHRDGHEIGTSHYYTEDAAIAKMKYLLRAYPDQSFMCVKEERMVPASIFYGGEN